MKTNMVDEYEVIPLKKIRPSLDQYFLHCSSGIARKTWNKYPQCPHISGKSISLCFDGKSCSGNIILEIMKEQYYIEAVYTFSDRQGYAYKNKAVRDLLKNKLIDNSVIERKVLIYPPEIVLTDGKNIINGEWKDKSIVPVQTKEEKKSLFSKIIEGINGV